MSSLQRGVGERAGVRCRVGITKEHEEQHKGGVFRVIRLLCLAPSTAVYVGRKGVGSTVLLYVNPCGGHVSPSAIVLWGVLVPRHTPTDTGGCVGDAHNVVNNMHEQDLLTSVSCFALLLLLLA